jgi:hypothetical protein
VSKRVNTEITSREKLDWEKYQGGYSQIQVGAQDEGIYLLYGAMIESYYRNANALKRLRGCSDGSHESPRSNGAS